MCFSTRAYWPSAGSALKSCMNLLFLIRFGHYFVLFLPRGRHVEHGDDERLGQE